MFFTKIFHFLRGYVILSLRGYSIERFINICARRGIKLLAIEKHGKTSAKAAVSMADFRHIRPVAYKTRTQVRIHKKRGLPYLISKYKHRYVLIGGAAACVVFLAVMSQFVWFIEFKGVENTDIETLKLAVQKAGVSAGVCKWSMPSAVDIKNVILNNTDGLSWVWVYVKGTKAVVEVRESVLAPNLPDKNTPCDIVALRDAVIKSVTAKNGEAYVKRGDAVLTGDVLIAGTLGSEVAEYRLCHALGTVEAYTYYKKSGEYKLYREIRTSTGKNKTKLTLHLFSKTLPLFKNQNPPYEEYDTKAEEHQLCIGSDYYLGIGVSAVTYNEVRTDKEPISYDAAVELAKADLEEKIAKELIPGADLQKETLSHEQVDADTIKVTLNMDFIEKIGAEKEIVVNNKEE